MKAAAYCRVSTEDQQERKTIENQVEFATKYTDLHNIELVKIYKDDGISGTIPFFERAAGKQLINDAKNKEFDTLLLYKLDRLGRSARITLNTIYELEALGITIKSMTEPFETDNPTGRFMITMLAGVADLERSTILERMQYGTEKAAKEGKWLGGIVPYGYKLNKNGFIEVNEEKMTCGLSEADVIRKIYNMLAIEKSTTFKIADYLNGRKIPTHYIKANRKVKNGILKLNTEGIWRPAGISNLVKNSVYKGIHEYGKRRTKDDRPVIRRSVPNIVSEEVFDLALRQMVDNRYKARKNTKNREYLLKGFIKCGHCNRTYIGTTYKSSKIVDGERTYLAYYICVGKSNTYKYISDGQCIGKSVRADKIENYVWGSCEELINNPSRLKEVLNMQNSKNKANNKIDYSDEIEQLKNSIVTLENEKQNILLLYRKNLISIDEIELHLKDIENERELINQKIKSFKDQQSQFRLASLRIKTFEASLNYYKNRIDTADFQVKREIITALINKVVVYTNNSLKDTTIEIEYSFFKEKFLV